MMKKKNDTEKKGGLISLKSRMHLLTNGMAIAAPTRHEEDGQGRGKNVYLSEIKYCKVFGPFFLSLSLSLFLSVCACACVCVCVCVIVWVVGVE